MQLADIRDGLADSRLACMFRDALDAVEDMDREKKRAIGIAALALGLAGLCGWIAARATRTLRTRKKAMRRYTGAEWGSMQHRTGMTMHDYGELPPAV
jgi:hypothetical protein